MSAVKTPSATSKSAKSDSATSRQGNGNSSDEKLLNELDKLDQIRDMLFGEQVSALRKQCQSLEKSLGKNISGLRSEMKASINELKGQIEHSIDQLQKRINAEEGERTGQHDELSSQLSNINSDITTKIDLETKRLDDAIEQQYQESTRQLDTVAESLQDSKLDRKTLAKFFSQFAEELQD